MAKGAFGWLAVTRKKAEKRSNQSTT